MCGCSVLWLPLSSRPHRSSPSHQNYQAGSEKFHVKVVSKIYVVTEIKDNCAKNRWLFLPCSYIYMNEPIDSFRWYLFLSQVEWNLSRFTRRTTTTITKERIKNTQLFDTFQGHAQLKMSFSTSRKVHLHFPKTGSLETPTGRTLTKLVRSVLLVNKWGVNCWVKRSSSNSPLTT